MRELESISGRMATGSTKFDVLFKALLRVFAYFWRFANVCYQNGVVEWIELLELCLERK